MIDLQDYIVNVEDSKSSRRLYRMICRSCSKDRGYQRKVRYGLGLCKLCASSFAHKGKIVTSETRQRMSKNNHIKNSGKHPLLGKKHTVKTKAKLSKVATAQNKKYKGKHKYVGSNGMLSMRSTWEVRYAIWLDGQNIGWNYEPTFELSNGKMYTPDFRLEDGTIVEIKSYFREDAKIKWQMFVEEYPKLNKLLLMKNELREMGVL